MISAKENTGIHELKTIIKEEIVRPTHGKLKSDKKIIFLGKPNSGKSTLINRLIRNDKIITSNLAGSTIDVIDNYLNYRNQNFNLLDSAGIIKKSQTKTTIKKYSINNTITHLHDSDLCIFILDGSVKITKQDKSLVELIHSHRVPYFIIVVNKIDLISEKALKDIRKSIKVFDQIVLNTPVIYTSALKNKNVKSIKDKIYVMCKVANKEYKTSFLNKILAEAINKHQPPVDNKRVRLKF